MAKLYFILNQYIWWKHVTQTFHGSLATINSLQFFLLFFQPPQFSVLTVSPAGSCILDNYLKLLSWYLSSGASPAGPFSIATTNTQNTTKNSYACFSGKNELKGHTWANVTMKHITKTPYKGMEIGYQNQKRILIKSVVACHKISHTKAWAGYYWSMKLIKLTLFIQWSSHQLGLAVGLPE